MCALVTGVQWFALPIYRVACIEIVAAVGDQIILRNKTVGIRCADRLIVPDQFDVRIDICQSPDRAGSLQRIEPVDAMEDLPVQVRSEEHTSELQSLMRISYAVFCLKKKNT